MKLKKLNQVKNKIKFSNNNKINNSNQIETLKMEIKLIQQQHQMEINSNNSRKSQWLSLITKKKMKVISLHKKELQL